MDSTQDWDYWKKKGFSFLFLIFRTNSALLRIGRQNSDEEEANKELFFELAWLKSERSHLGNPC